MTWRGHTLITSSIVYIFTGNPLWAFLSSAGSVLPDALEFAIYGRSVPQWSHRKWTHWFVPYLACCVVFLFVSYQAGVLSWSHHIPSLLNVSGIVDWLATGAELPFYGLVALLLAGVCAGGLAHIVEDAVTGRVPGLHPARKTFGKRIFRVRSFQERMIVGLFLVLEVFRFMITAGLSARF